MNIILILISLSLGDSTDKPQEIKGLLKWNLAEIDRFVTPPARGFPVEMREELLGVSFIYAKSRFGLGIAALEAWEFNALAILPIQAKALIWFDKKGLFGSPFVCQLNGFCHVHFFHVPYFNAVSVDAGLEFTPGVLLNMRAGYLTVIGQNNSTVYFSIGAFIGAVHKIW